MQNELLAKYKFWKTNTIIGLFVWPLCFMFVLLGNALIGAGGGNDAEIAKSTHVYFQYALFFSLLLGIVCLILAKYFFEKGSVRSATQTLKIPFYYLVLFLFVYFYVDSL